MMASQKTPQTCSSTHYKTKTLPSSSLEGNLCSYMYVYIYRYTLCMYILYIYIILLYYVIELYYIYMYHVFSLSLYAQRMAPILVVICSYANIHNFTMDYVYSGQLASWRCFGSGILLSNWTITK